MKDSIQNLMYQNTWQKEKKHFGTIEKLQNSINQQLYPRENRSPDANHLSVQTD